MATLNTLRTRFGVVLSAVIAFALLAFVFSLKAEMGFMGSEPIVAEIDGHNVTYTEYQTEYNKIMQMSGSSASTEREANMLYTQTWQSLFSKFAVIPSIEQMGFAVTESERLAIIRGEIATQTMFGTFGDPSTGMYDVAALNNFLLNSQGNPEAEAIWAMINDQARDERLTTKFASLVAAGSYANALEVAKGVEAANKTYNGKWTIRRYTDVEDSAVTVSAAEVKAYYDEHKSSYKRDPSRTISYAKFNIEPSKGDLDRLKVDAELLGEQFAKAEDIRAFIRSNRNGSISNYFMSIDQFSKEEADELGNGRMYGPVEVDKKWRVARVLKSVLAPDTVALRHIVLSYTEKDLADSLLVALRKGGDFAEAAATYSMYQQTAQVGGDLGSMPFSSFTDEFVDKLATAKKGDIVEIESGDMIQLIEVYKVGSQIPHYQLASIEIPILPTETTRHRVHNAAGTFAVAAKSVVDETAFKAAASESDIISRNASLTTASRTISVIPGSSEVARWANRAEVGDISEIFKVEDAYVVAMLTSINDSEHRPMSEVEGAIKRQLRSDKKFEVIKSELNGSLSLEDQAAAWNGKVSDFENVTFASTYISGMGVEPRAVGAITSTSSVNKISEPIKGSSGLYLFEVTEIVESEEPQTAAEEKVRAEAMSANIAQQTLLSAIESISVVEDKRGAAL